MSAPFKTLVGYGLNFLLVGHLSLLLQEIDFLSGDVSAVFSRVRNIEKVADKVRVEDCGLTGIFYDEIFSVFRELRCRTLICCFHVFLHFFDPAYRGLQIFEALEVGFVALQGVGAQQRKPKAAAGMTERSEGGSVRSCWKRPDGLRGGFKEEHLEAIFSPQVSILNDLFRGFVLFFKHFY